MERNADGLRSAKWVERQSARDKKETVNGPGGRRTVNEARGQRGRED